LTQLLAFVAIVFWTTMLLDVEAMARARRAMPTPSPTSAATSADRGQPVASEVNSPRPKRPSNSWQAKWLDKVKQMSATEKSTGKRQPIRQWIEGYEQMLVEVALVLPVWAFPLIWGLKIVGFIVYLFQIPVTYAARRLDYELRWYMVTDRSLRLRSGIWKISESTMSFANIQQVVVLQGPLQRWLSLADVEVKSAGGGTVHPKNKEDDMHTGIFHCVTNAPEIRDLILERLRQFRASGLGDPDEKTTHAASTNPAASDGNPLAAAREFLAETKALRVAISR
jgi:membrane protein YdbS with pleckstrin-like domain